jgi:rubrerythrin
MEIINIINGCVAMEEAVASIYRTFMRLFPEEKTFWEDLANDETQHQAWITDAKYIESIDLLSSKDILPSMEHIALSLKSTALTIEHIKSNPVTLEEALKIALRLEETMVEIFANELTANLFAHDYESLSRRLITAEKLHVSKIEDLMIERGFMQVS